jgi:hypothetical protein
MDEPPITKDTAEDLLDYTNIARLRAKNAEFNTWFGKNHLDIEVWNKITHEMEPGYQRIYIWNQIKPNNPKYYKTYTLSDGTVLPGTPTTEYYSRRVKDEYRTGYDATTEEIMQDQCRRH